MSGAGVVVVGAGVVTAVGVSVLETSASVRARLSRFTATAMYDRRMQPFTVAEVADEALPALAEPLGRTPGLSARETRMLRLAGPALRECLAPLAGGSPPALALCLALPELETARPLDRARFARLLALQAGGVFDGAASDASHVGRAGGVLAIGQAVATIAHGRAPFVLAGGVDTFRDLHVLGTLDLERRVRSEANMDGFIPGEGAGFLLLAGAAAAAGRGLAPLAAVSAPGLGFESGHLYSAEPYRGEGLASALRALVASRAVDAPLGEVYSSMNGESHWAKEWGVAEIRHRAAFHPDRAMHHPADCFGDTGAACGPIMTALAATSLRAGRARGPALVYGSSDRGARAAVVVSSPAH